MGDTMDHDPKICTICARNDRVRFDAETGHHFVPHYCEAAFPLFKLYPVVPESV
jgi:hypothetical protein